VGREASTHMPKGGKKGIHTHAQRWVERHPHTCPKVGREASTHMPKGG